MKAAQLEKEGQYLAFDRIDGSHPFKLAVPDGFIDYPVRTRAGGSVTFFNFSLAKEMGLIPQDHPEEVNARLQEKLLETFSLVIINEYDQLKKIQYPPNEIRPNKYMATRYLQLQHPDKRGRTSGDGRGIWNGLFRGRGHSWDISSSGTGATSLSPACAQEKRFFKTGDRQVGYGNGYNTLDEGMSAALMSEVFHHNGIPTERTLAIIGFKDGTSINVRAAQCLLRPSHFFHHLKQGACQNLKRSIDFFIDRQVANGNWVASQSLLRDPRRRYEFMAEQVAKTFANTAALFESHYIFCWLDWDGDNILAGGGIIDYGSVRQFGLFHRGYRYEDVDRYSTNIVEQKAKAREIVRNFAQIRDFLIYGKKRNIRRYKCDSLLSVFDKEFQRTLNDQLLKKIGFSEKHRAHLLHRHMGLIESFRKYHTYFERQQSKRKVYRVADGITRDAVFCTREILKELPKRYLAEGRVLNYDTFLNTIRSCYAKPRDLLLNTYRKRAIDRFQEIYLKMIQRVAEEFTGGSQKRVLLEICMRSSVINRSDRITGDAAIEITHSLIRNLRKLSATDVCRVIAMLVEHQKFLPDKSKTAPREALRKGSAKKLVEKNINLIYSYREGL